ncbi:hypothetical protein L2E82_16912 [Cichorium intybus]|uniref:Uncharacterized protein n=1 Tax=Cichorium intybus TaxID=13427 RepID=A0ACB9F6U0_CICIN|nr:hypothetical protein L2E82_16912 [Cichorium intybus]
MKKRQVVVKKSSSNKTSSASMIQRIRYGECQKNHAADIGGYAVDGCREFMASGEEGTTAALVCAACGCHRSFHRREVDEVVCEGSSTSEVYGGILSAMEFGDHMDTAKKPPALQLQFSSLSWIDLVSFTCLGIEVLYYF